MYVYNLLNKVLMDCLYYPFKITEFLACLLNRVFGFV